MNLTINLANRAAIHDTYGDCEEWRAKGGILRKATPPDFKPFDPSQLVPHRKWHTLLELGCGLEGWIAGVVTKAGPNASIYAYDISEDMLRKFFREYIAASPAVKPRPYCVIGDGQSLPFARNSFDGISAIFVGHHMNNAEEFVSGLTRVLKPDGWLLTNSLDWSFPAPDFPSQGLQKLVRETAKFIVQNAFDEKSARKALDRSFAEVHEKRITIPATIRSVDDLTRLHSRLEYFIRRALPPHHEWSDYIRCVAEIAQEHIRRNGSYYMELPITYFIAQRPRTLESSDLDNDTFDAM